MAKDEKVPVVPDGAPARSADGLERRLLEDGVNRAVAAVRRLEVELRGARAAERKARAALGDLAASDEVQDRR